MSSPATAPLDRAAINRANSEHSTGPRTDLGKQRSSLNALRHGLTARTAVLLTEDRAAFDQHCRGFFDEYQPATPTENHLVQELADTSWRLRRVPLVEATLLTNAIRPSQLADPQPTIHSLSMLGLHGARLSRQFQKTLQQLRQLQAERRERERPTPKEAPKEAAEPSREPSKAKRIPKAPTHPGFVFSNDQTARAPI
jgi:hypothetical protein